MRVAPTELLIVQPTKYCNLDCDYCYLPDRGDSGRMSVDTVKAIASFLGGIEIAVEPLQVAWHAGEPLAVRRSFYEEAFSILAETQGCPPLRHSLQTNATLVTDEWCELFKTWSVHVGVSLDGPKFLHDAHRRDRRGVGSYERVVEGVQRLQSHGIRPSVIAVLTRESLNHVDEIWNFFRDMGLNQLGFSIEEMDGCHNSTSLRIPESRAAYYWFIRRLFELRDLEPTVSVRELSELEDFLSLPPGTAVRGTENQVGAIISIARDGGISTLSPELLGMAHPDYGAFSWGNVFTDSWLEVTANPALVRVASSVDAGVARCLQTCSYFSVCGGGVPSNKLGEHSTFDCTQTSQCEIRIMAGTDAALDHLGW